MAADRIVIGFSDKAETLLLKRANRHGLVAGATGTGKTVTLQVLAEGFSAAGVPVFAADIKGDLSGIAAPGAPNAAFDARAADMGLTLNRRGFPAVFWDVFGEKGHPVRATISEMGPLMLSRLMGLNETQAGVLSIVFRVADDEGLLLLDLKDLRAMLSFVAERAAEIGPRYGNVSKASVGAIQRQLLALEGEGADRFFGEPALYIHDFMRWDRRGYGAINILAADRLMHSPRLYATFLLWMLSELFEELPEVGDPERPKLVFFFDEAHLLFDDAPKALVDKIEQVVRLIRSKGVGVYFVTQNPLDLPETVLGQLGNRVQHALRAFTPRDQKAVRAAAETFRPNPALDTARAVTELAVGEALVSLLEADGAPSVVERTRIRPPEGRVGPLSDEERQRIIAASPLRARYEATVDRESAYEILTERAAGTRGEAPAAPAGRSAGMSAGKSAPAPAGDSGPGGAEEGGEGGLGGLFDTVFGTGRARGRRLTPLQSAARSVTREMAGRVAGDLGRKAAGSVGGSIGRAVVRGILGSILR
ncbi:helicase HerA-like domain-containing protein [Pseudoxanthobacter sp.]|uniref:helicase HerA-like domain-containing protein n=1 Tax=Pseudoxanthobacter sp. TaxID=1925742 RepID=UPI002FE40B04